MSVYKRRSKKEIFLLDLYIVNHIRKHGKLPRCVDSKLTKANMSYHLKHLKIEGIITNRGYGVWVLNYPIWQKYLAKRSQVKPRKTTLHTRHTSQVKIPKKKTIRGHAYIMTLEVPNIYKGYKLTSLAKRLYEGKGINKDQRVWSSEINKRRVWFARDSINIFFNKAESFFGQEADFCEKSAIYQFHRMLKGVERSLSVDLKIRKTYSFRVSRSEYANINNDLAKDYNDRKEKLRIFKDGKQWALVDDSFNLNEFEMTHAKTSKTDTDNVIMPFFNDLKGHYENTKETLTMSSLLRVMSKQTTAIASQSNLIVENKNNISRLVSIFENVPDSKDFRPEYIN